MRPDELLELINSTDEMKIAELEDVKANYINVFNETWKNDGGAASYARQSRYFNALLEPIVTKAREKGWVLDKFSIYSCFIEEAITDLSLKPGARAMAYLQDRWNVKNIHKINFVVSGYGELEARIRCGQIKSLDNPTVVYSGDTFEVFDENGKKGVLYRMNMSHNEKEIVAAYTRINRADGSTDLAIMLKHDWMRLCDYSDKQNRSKNDNREPGKAANALYYSYNGGIDPGFLCAKLIKHALKTLKDVPIGCESVMEDDVQDFNGNDEPFGVDEPTVTYCDELDPVHGVMHNQQTTDDDIF